MILHPDDRATPEQVERARARIELKALLDSPGWQNHVKKLLLEGIQQSMNALRHVDTADPQATVDAVQRWQLRHTDYENLCNYVNALIAPDDPNDDNLKISDMEVILQEALHGRGDDGPHPGPEGY